MSNTTFVFNGTCPQGDQKDLCAIGICPLECAQVEYLPSMIGNIIYAAIFGILLVAQVFLGIRHKTWGFMVGMILGLLLEIIGYVGRIMLHNNPFEFNNFIIYLVPITIGPAFLTGAIYLCLSRIIVVHGQEIARFKPRTYSLLFMSCDFLSLVLQAAGGAMASIADDKAGSDRGKSIMIAGLVFQVVSLLVYMTLWGEFLFRLRRTKESFKDHRFVELRGTRMFKWFSYAMWLAVVLILIRSAYRVAELQEGFHGKLAGDQVLFMVLEGPMIFVAVAALTVIHPGVAFDGQWADAAWSLKGYKKAPAGKAIPLEEQSFMSERTSYGQA